MKQTNQHQIYTVDTVGPGTLRVQRMPGGIPGGIPGGRMPGIPGGTGGIPPGIPGGAIIGGIPGGLIPGGIPGGTPPGMPGNPPGIPAPAVNCAGPPALGCICAGAGPPMPRTGPAKPEGAVLSGATGTPRPATCPRPAPACISAFFGPVGGGDSAIIDTMVSPRSTTNPKDRLTSFSSSFLPFALIFRNSSQSARTMFMYLSNAIKDPTNIRESEIVTRTR